MRRQRRDRIYMLKYRIGGRQRWYVIGPHGSPWTVEGARKEARRLLGQVAERSDPAAKRAQTKAAGSVRELCDLYLAEAPTRILRKTGQPKKASSFGHRRRPHRTTYQAASGSDAGSCLLEQDVESFLADMAAGKTAADVKTGPRGRAVVEGGEGAATRTVGLLGGIFAYAAEKGMRHDNPVRGVTRYKDRSSKRYLSAAELAKLGEALATADRDGENATATAAVRLLILTGCRKSEILAARREWVDAEHGYLHLPDSKTGQKLVPLGAPALAVIAELPQVKGNPYLLPGEKKNMHFVGLPKAWDRIKRRAGLNDVRLHDLRHAFASVGASGGTSLLVIGALLGHRDTKRLSVMHICKMTRCAPPPIEFPARLMPQ